MISFSRSLSSGSHSPSPGRPPHLLRLKEILRDLALLALPTPAHHRTAGAGLSPEAGLGKAPIGVVGVGVEAPGARGRARLVVTPTPGTATRGEGEDQGQAW